MDCDGVLNNNKTKTFHTRVFDPQNIIQLDRIIQVTGCKVVLSSAWRLGGIESIYDPLDNACIGNKDMADRIKQAVIDKTPNYVQDKFERGYEIQAWIDKNDFVGTFVIIDDVPDMVHLLDHLVLTKDEGLTEELADRAILLFSGS